MSLSHKRESVHGMLITYVTSRLGCVRVLARANFPLKCMGKYAEYDRSPLPCVKEFSIYLHIDVNFQNGSIH